MIFIILFWAEQFLLNNAARLGSSWAFSLSICEKLLCLTIVSPDGKPLSAEKRNNWDYL